MEPHNAHGRLKQTQTTAPWTKVEERYLKRALKESREVANCYTG